MSNTMQWVKASERLPEPILGVSTQYFVRAIHSKDKKVVYFGNSSRSLLLTYPAEYEWLEESESGAGMAEALEERDKLKKALRNLVSLKNWKDEHGKDSHYEQFQPEAWQYAKDVLAALGNK